MKNVIKIPMMCAAIGVMASTAMAQIPDKIEMPGYFLQGIVKGGSLYRSKVFVYDKDNKEIASAIINKPNGMFLFTNLEKKPYYVKVQDGIDIGMDRKIGGGDDNFFDEVYFAKVKDKTVRVNPSSTLSYFVGEDIALDKKNNILLEEIINLLEGLGLNSVESYKAVAYSLDNNENNIFELDVDKLKDFLDSINIKYDVNLEELIGRLKDIVKEFEFTSKEDIYAVSSVVNTVKNIIEYKKFLEFNNSLEDYYTLLDRDYVENVKDILYRKKNVDLSSFSAVLTNRVVQKGYGIDKLVEKDMASFSKSNGIKVEKNSNIKVVDGPSAENFDIYMSVDNDGFLVENVFSNNHGICKIAENGVLKEIKLRRKYVRVENSENSSLEDKFNIVKDYLKNLFSFDINTKFNINGYEKDDLLLTVIIKKLNACNGKELGFLTASMIITMEKEDKSDLYKFYIPKGSKLFITGNTSKFNNFVLTKEIDLSDQLVAKSGSYHINIGDYVDSILTQYKQYISDDIKETVYTNVTNPGVFEIYILLNKVGTNEDGKDFIKNSYLFDATKGYQLDLNPYSQDFTSKEHSFKITVQLY